MRPVLSLSLAVLLAAPAASGQDVVGTWELVSAENVPYEDSLVFARVTFTGDVLRSTYVFLDPDDGELIGRLNDDRYFVSDGQLIVRGAGSTTVLDVDREGDRLAVLDLQTGVRLHLRAADPALDRDPALLGRWRSARGGRALEFYADGAVDVWEDGEDEPDGRSYVVAGPYLLIDDQPFSYTVTSGGDGPRLFLGSDGERTQFLPVGR